MDLRNAGKECWLGLPMEAPWRAEFLNVFCGVFCNKVRHNKGAWNDRDWGGELGGYLCRLLLPATGWYALL